LKSDCNQNKTSVKPYLKQNWCHATTETKPMQDRNKDQNSHRKKPSQKDHTTEEILNKPERLQGGGEDLNTSEGYNGRGELQNMSK